MDFTKTAFQTAGPVPKVSDDTLSHANLVMACRWGWTSSPESNGGAQTAAPSSTTLPATTSTSYNIRSKRFAPCQGRLYHQLLCSHRVRTDLVEDCGTNCVEPMGDATASPFLCNECIEAEAIKIWDDRKTEHNASYPPLEQMSKDHYDQWYLEHRQLEAEYVRDRKIYEMDLKSKTRPSNICSSIEASKDELEFASELDSLSLSLMASGDGASVQSHTRAHTGPRASLPTDASEQLHWDLNTLTLDRGSCGVEYTASHSPTHLPTMQQMSEEELWGKSQKRG